MMVYLGMLPEILAGWLGFRQCENLFRWHFGSLKDEFFQSHCEYFEIYMGDILASRLHFRQLEIYWIHFGDVLASRLHFRQFEIYWIHL